MEQFSLEKYLANPSRKVVTRDGRRVRIICTDRRDLNFPIVTLIERELGEGGWFMFGIDSCLWQGVAIKYVHQLQQVLRLAGMTELANNFKI